MKKILQLLVLVFITNGFAQVLELNPASSGLVNPSNFIEFNSKMYFIARNAAFQYCLFATDGTAASNEQIKVLSFSPTIPANSVFEHYKIVFNNKLYFSGDGGFYQSDGTTAGTSLFGTGIVSFVKYFKIFNNRLYFVGNNNANGYEIWSTDGTAAGTTMLKDIFTGTTGSINPINDPHFTIFNNKLFFVANDGVTGWELWSTDGTESGTSLFKDIRTNEPGYDGFGAFQIQGFYSQTSFKVVNNKMYFAACPYEYASSSNPQYLGLSEYVLYETDGTVGGTHYVSVPPFVGSPFTYGYLYNIKGLTVDNNQLFVFGIQNSSSVLSGGVFKIDNINPVVRLKYFSGNLGDSGTSEQTEKFSMKFYNGNYYFLGSDASNSPNNLSLWKMNPTNYEFANIIGINGFEAPTYLTASVFNNKLYFLKTGTGNLFSTDGSVIGTTIEARNSETIASNTTKAAQNFVIKPEQLKNFNNALYFQASFVLGQPAALWRLNNNNLSNKDFSTSKLNLFPNPATSQINLSFENNLENANLKIISILGQTVFEKQNISRTDFNFDVSGLTNGIYLVQVIDGNKVMNSKFIKE